MSTYTFTLILTNPSAVTPEFEDAVFEAGCADAALGQRSGVVYLQFDREAASFLDAVLSAIQDVNSMPEAVVAHVEPDELVTASDIAYRIGRTRESVRLLIEGTRGPGGFPVPVSGASDRRTRFWRWSEVAEWLDEHGYTVSSTAEARVIAAVNGALDLTHNTGERVRKQVFEAVQKAS